MSSNALVLLLNTVNSFVNIYFVLLVVRILLSWFPNIDWYSQPFAVLSQLTDPYLNLFRRIIPPLGGIDFSPILAFLALQLVQSTLLPLVATALASLTTAFPA